MEPATRLTHWIDTMPASIKVAVDLAAVVASLGTVVKLLPILATLLPIIWWAIRIYETDTVKGWLDRRPAEQEQGNDAGR
jgi:hypothetical protein